MASSPFLLNGVLEAHLDEWEKRNPLLVAELRKALYVDDLLTGGAYLHKWNSNVRELEDDKSLHHPEEQTFAKEQLNVEPGQSKMLGLKWDKCKDTLAVVIPSEEITPTKRGILGKLARVYDFLGFVSPLTLIGKNIYTGRSVIRKFHGIQS